MIYVKVIIMFPLGHKHPWDSISRPVLASDRVFFLRGIIPCLNKNYRDVFNAEFNFAYELYL